MKTRKVFSEISNVAEALPRTKLSIKTPVGSKKPCQEENTAKKAIQIRPIRANPPDQPAPAIENIDTYYKGSLFFLSEYAPDVFRHLMKIESQTPIQRWPLNPLITSNMRGKVIDWIASVVDCHRFLQETFHLTVSLFDRYLQSNPVDKTTIQLVAVCCLNLAIKYEETQDVSVRDLLSLVKNAYTRKKFLEMEILILKSVRFSLGRPLPITFLRRFNMVAKADRLQHAYGKFLLDLCMLEAKLCHIAPSMLAAASTFVAICIVQKEVSPSVWSPTLAHYTTYELERLKPLVHAMSAVMKCRGGEFRAVTIKYSKSEQFGVSERIASQEYTLSKIKNLK